jgi:hypothetical protein
MLFNIGATRFWPRRQFLTDDDYRNSAELIQTGDIVLVGNHRKLTAFAIRGIVTHSLLYIGNGECIHADGDGVERITYQELFDIYDTLVVIRISASEQHKAEAVAWMRRKLGLPYDYNFNATDAQELFCTELVCDAYHFAHSDLPPCVKKQIVLPRDLVSGIGTRIFHSKSLHEVGGKLVLNPAMYRNSLVRAVFST